ncbi:MAG: protein-export membrane protein SecF [Gammaproteobacteria bacterium GWE2_37_16]|nr:MAG: protein-export membrane protein SecF [Gammaproteobacteria bacterium GWE2_37_16]
MEFFSHKTSIDFMAQRKWAALFSCILFAIAIISLSVKGLEFGLDFTGGTQMQVSYAQPADLNQIRQQLNQSDFSDAVAQAYGSTRDVMIRFKPHKNVSQQDLNNQVLGVLHGATFQSAEFIGPQVGKALVTNGILAIVISLLAIMIYIALRFEYRFAISAALSLIHDPIIILGVFSLFHIEFNLIALASILTVLGYSLNDTIVVYDRARENFRKFRKSTATEILNLSVNQTLSRTIMTSGLTLVIISALLIFGGEMLFGFSLAMIIGILIGTYSSIYVAGALALMMGLNKAHFVVAEKKYVDNMP